MVGERYLNFSPKNCPVVCNISVCNIGKGVTQEPLQWDFLFWFLKI